MLASWFFNRYGDQYFLSKIWPPSSDSGRELTKSRLEREVAAQSRVKPALQRSLPSDEPSSLCRGEAAPPLSPRVRPFGLTCQRSAWGRLIYRLASNFIPSRVAAPLAG